MAIRTLVTGGSGFIGITLVERLRRSGRDVVSLGTRPTTPPGQDGIYSRVDILNSREVAAALHEIRPQQVVHLAARADFAGHDDFYGYSVNTQGTRNVVNAIKKTPGVTRAVFASSLVVETSVETYEYGYSRSKAEMEQIVERSELAAGGCNWALMRLGHVWGPWVGTPYRSFFLAIYRGHYFNLGHTDVPKHLVYVGNAAHQIEGLLDAPADRMNGKLFYIAEKTPLCISEWARLIASALKLPPPRHIPEYVVRLAARSGDVLQSLGWPNPPLSSRRLANMRTDPPTIPIQETLDLVGRSPFTTAEGVEATISWLRQQRHIK